MPAPVSVIIAARNEEERIGAAIDSAFAADAGEVIVADGSSTDRTRDIAREHGATVIECEAMRARQLNRGAERAKYDALIFLHADTTLPANAAAAVIDALKSADFGGFRISFAERSLKLKLAAALINIRTSITKKPWGDQAQFIKRSAFTGFREIPLMEDYELALRMQRRTMLPLHIKTSGRRFLEKGLIRTAFTNWRIIAAWHRGKDANELARIYRS
jgi:rSAM/selenodomain-associated transferase 2